MKEINSHFLIKFTFVFLANVFMLISNSFANQCSDGIDNDNDGLVDWQYDLGCINSDDNSEGGMPKMTFENGWTVIEPHASTKITFLSSSEGNDSVCHSYTIDELRALNGDYSAIVPCATLSKGYQLLRSGYPDWLLLKRGDTWVNEIFADVWDKSGLSNEDRMVISSYGGQTQRPLLKVGRLQLILSLGDDHLFISGLDIYAHTRNPTGGEYVSPEGKNAFSCVYDCENIRLEDNAFRFTVGVPIASADATPTRCWGNISNIEVHRNIFAYSYSVNSHCQGLYTLGGGENACPDSPPAGGYVGITENVFHHNGWYDQNVIPGSRATIFNRSMYLSHGGGNSVVQGNIDSDGASGGIQLRDGGLIENNLVLKAPVGISVSHAQNDPASTAYGIIRNNVLLDSRDIHDQPRGFGIGLGGENVNVYNNIVAHQRLGTSNIQGIAYGGLGAGLLDHLRRSTIHDNIVYDWARPGTGLGSTLVFNPPSMDVVDVTVENNSFQQPLGGKLASVQAPMLSGIQFRNNKYYSSSNPSSLFSISNADTDFSTWQSQSGETGQFQQLSYSDPNRSIETYMASIGQPASYDAFIAEAMNQSKYNWRPQYMAYPVNDYVREGFNLSPVPTTCDISRCNDGIYCNGEEFCEEGICRPGTRPCTDNEYCSENTHGCTTRPNLAPTVNAGVDQSVTAPAQVQLNATVSDDGLPVPPRLTTVQWTSVTGPGAVSFVDANNKSTRASFSRAGLYTLRISAYDGALTVSDDVQVQVQPGSITPVDVAGQNRFVPCMNPTNPDHRVRKPICIENKEGQVNITVLTTQGEHVRTLTNEHRSSGASTVYWDGRNDTGESVASGIYILSMEVGGETTRTKIVHLK